MGVAMSHGDSVPHLQIWEFPMMKLISAASLFLALSGCSADHATTASSVQSSTGLNVPANHCEIYVERLETAPSSHGSGSLKTIVRVPWLGDGEQVQVVGFYGKSQAHDLGNSPNCHFSAQYNDPEFKFHGPATAYPGETQLGEYLFEFPVHSGSVVDECPGFEYAWIGSFFVQTNVKTYWVNPNMNPAENFYLDENGWQNIEHRVGTYEYASTLQDGFGYYNPRQCSR